MKNKEIDELHKPTELQFKLFAQHISNCHSWYKHLPLLTGGHFIVFLDMNAGVNYPALHPKLPYGNSYDKYKEAFGYLNYCYKTELMENWQLDNNTTIKNNNEFGSLRLPNYMLDRCSFILYPFISDEFVESYNYHKKGFDEIRNGKDHPYAEKLLFLENLHNRNEQLWNNFNEEEMDTILSISEYSVRKSNISNDIDDFINIKEEEDRLLEQLRFEECKKIMIALENLKAYYK